MLFQRRDRGDYIQSRYQKRFVLHIRVLHSFIVIELIIKINETDNEGICKQIKGNKETVKKMALLLLMKDRWLNELFFVYAVLKFPTDARRT